MRYEFLEEKSHNNAFLIDFMIIKKYNDVKLN